MDDIEPYYRNQEINIRTSVIELQEQSAFTLNVEVRKGKKITGGFGKSLYKAEWIDRKELPVVLIEMKGSKISNEVYLYITLDHPHIIKTYGIVDPNDYSTDSNSILLLQEYTADGDLAGLLLNRYFIPQQNVLVEIFLQIADAMIFLSKNGIIHADLACRNVLVFKSHPHDPKKNLVKLTDFGSTRNDSSSSDIKIDIPVRFVAQEILRSKGQSGYSEKSDVYSFAVFMWEACSFGKMPYEYINDDEEVSRQKLKGKRLTKPDKCDPNIWKLINLCWNDEPEDRPNFQKIHTQLKNIQNVESSSARSNSSLSSSPSNLFQIEYQTCRDCNLRYTDYDSHLNNCSEGELICDTCGKSCRRASFNKHQKNCNHLFDDANSSKQLDQKSSSQIPSSSSLKTRVSSHSEPNRDDSYRSTLANDRSLINSSDQSDKNTRVPPNRSSRVPESSRRAEPINYRRTSVRETSSELNTTQIPCEICGKSFDVSELNTHQEHCIEQDRKRLEDMRINIEKQKALDQVKCKYCTQNCLNSKLDEHENTCKHNPVNVSDLLSSTRSNSVPDLPLTSRFSKLSISNESLPVSKAIQASKSTNELRTSESVGNTTKEEPSGFRKFVSNLWPFKKKGSGK